MQILKFTFLAFLAATASLFSICSYADDDQFVYAVGFAECKDCVSVGVTPGKVFAGLHETVGCKAADGHVKTSHAAALSDDGKFRVSIPKNQARLIKECSAKLNSASPSPFPADIIPPPKVTIYKPLFYNPFYFPPSPPPPPPKVSINDPLFYNPFRFPPPPPPVPIFKPKPKPATTRPDMPPPPPKGSINEPLFYNPFRFPCPTTAPTSPHFQDEAKAGNHESRHITTSTGQRP